MLRVCARSVSVEAAATISAAANPPVNIERAAPAIDRGVSAARPNTVNPPGTIARRAAAHRMSVERSAANAA